MHTVQTLHTYFLGNHDCGLNEADLISIADANNKNGKMDLSDLKLATFVK